MAKKDQKVSQILETKIQINENKILKNIEIYKMKNKKKTHRDK